MNPTVFIRCKTKADKKEKKAETRKKKALTGIKVQNKKWFTSQAGEQNTGEKKQHLKQKQTLRQSTTNYNVFTKTKMERADKIKQERETNNFLRHSCFSAEFLFLLWGVYLCYAVRTVPSAFHEPRYMAAAVYNELLISAIFHIIRWVQNDRCMMCIVKVLL